MRFESQQGRNPEQSVVAQKTDIQQRRSRRGKKNKTEITFGLENN
jgi:hypothetical protein